ncbi:MAG: right-handed parallel beta-helix repeat-containing protein, partial [Crenarchaeota archaeon]|nr:right-handed parallel beta-helix repeat-containing protein [Thermoproteota archaeon]
YNILEKVVPISTHEPINNMDVTREMPFAGLRNLDIEIKHTSTKHSLVEPKFQNAIVIPPGNTTIITGNQTYTDTVFIVYGNLTIVDANVVFNETSGIFAENGSIVKIVNSKITYYQTPKYIIRADANTTIIVEEGEIVGCTDFSTGDMYEYIGVKATLTIKNSKLIDTQLYAMYSDVTINYVEVLAEVGGGYDAITLEGATATVENLNICGKSGHEFTTGLYLCGTVSTLKGVNISGTRHALYMRNLTGATVRNCIFKNNSLDIGIAVSVGISIEDCKFNTIYVGDSVNVSIISCQIEKAAGALISPPLYFCYTRNITLINNTMIGLSPVFYGFTFWDFSTHKIEGNKVNGKDLLYLVNAINRVITEEYGAIILVGVDNVVIGKQDISDVTLAMEIAFSEYVTIENPLIKNVKYGIYIIDSNVRIKDGKIKDAFEGIQARGSDVFINNAYMKHCECGIFAMDSTIFVNRTQIVESGSSITVAGGKLKVMNSVIYMNDLGISVGLGTSKTEVHYCSIYTNKRHGIYSCAAIIINASYNWWGVNGAAPELKESGEPFDPEEVWGNFTNDTFMKPLNEPMWLPSEEGPPEGPLLPPGGPGVPILGVLIALALAIVVAAIIVIIRRRTR